MLHISASFNDKAIFRQPVDISIAVELYDEAISASSYRSFYLTHAV
jgi:hypothetical protein